MQGRHRGADALKVPRRMPAVATPVLVLLYQKWQSLMYESAVRACVASFVRNSFPPKYLEYYLQEEAGDGFAWTRELSDLLCTYERNRNKYPTFESFFPQFVQFFDEYGRKTGQ